MNMKDAPFCPSCGNTNSTVLYASRDRMFRMPGSFRIRRCASCSLVFLDPFLSARETRKYYPSQTYYAYRGEAKKGLLGAVRTYLIVHYYKPTIFSILVSLFIHSVPAIPREVHHGKVLDLGCGTGDTLLLLQALGWDVYGMEMDKRAVERAHKRGLKNIRLGTFEDLSYFKNNSFDAVRLYHVIEHLPDPQLCFRLLYHALKNGGELIIGTPNISSIVARLFGTYWYNLDSPRHLFLFNPKTLRKMAEDAGFTVRSLEYCSAGGLVGSLQYWIDDTWNLDTDLIHRLWCILFFYPVEWLVDKLHMGDVFVMRMTK